MNRSLVALAHFSPRIVAVAAMLPVVLTLTMGVAHGQGAGDDVAAAKAHYAMGVRHFDLSEFEEALAEFKEAYRAKPDPVFLYNIGQCHRKLGHTEDAITFYQTYLRRAPDARNRDEVERRIAQLEALRDAQIASNANAAVAKSLPSPASAGAQEGAVGQTAETPSTTPALDVGVQHATASPPRGAFYKRWWFWTAVGAVAAGTATVAIIMAKRDPTEIPSTSLGSQRAMP